MKNFWRAAIGGGIALIGVVGLSLCLTPTGMDYDTGMMITFSVLIGTCTGLIYGKLREVHDDLCTASSQQEEIKAMVERLDKNVRELKRSRELEKEAADKKEPPADGE